MDKKQTWLILAHCFNMDGRAASQTITDRIPLLMKRGITPIVISAPTGTKDTKFPHYRVFSPAPSGVLFEMRQVIKLNLSNASAVFFLKALLTIFLIPFYLLEKLVVNLDSHWSWFVTAAIKGGFVIKKHKPQLVYSTAGPSSTHLAGFLLSRLFSLPWVCELHDPLIRDDEKKRYQRHAFNRWLEKLIFKHADAVIYFTEGALKSARNRTGVHGKGHVLRPGAVLPPMEPVTYRKRKKIHFGHFGSLTPDRHLGDFFKGVRLFFKQNPGYEQKFSIDIYGGHMDAVSKKMADECGLDSMIKPFGRLEYDPETKKTGRQQVVEQMFLSDVLVLIHGDSLEAEEYIPSKVYEYIQTSRPIFCLTSGKTELALLLKSLDHVVVQDDDGEHISKAIAALILKWEKNELFRIDAEVCYTVDHAVDQLIGIGGRITPESLAKK